MAGSGITPALATMPTEIVCMIGADLSIHDIKEWTLASKRFRNIFLSKVCEHIKFSGNMEQLEDRILSYFQTATASFRNVVHHHTRYVTFDVQAFDTPRSLRAWARQPPISSLPQIGRFIISNPNLHRVNFRTHLEGLKEIHLFRQLVEAGPQWPNVKNVSFQTPPNSSEVIRAVIQKLEEGTLQTISSCFGLFFAKDHMRDSYFANVTALSLRRQDRKDWSWLSRYRDPVIAGLDEDLLACVHRSFPQLESLVLYDGFLDDKTRRRPLADGAKFVRVIRLACSTLEKMQSLRRFAFGFDKSRLKPDAIPEILEQTPRDFNEKLGDEFDTGTVANCLLLSFLATQVSTLEEICMTTEYPEFYRITRKDGEFDIGRDSFDDPSQKDLFPSVLMG